MEHNMNFWAPLVINFFRYFIMAGIPFLIFYKLFPIVFSKNKIQGRSAKRNDFVREILHSLQTTFVIVLVGLLVLKTPLSSFTLVYTDLYAYPMWWIPLSVFLALALHDTYFYWMHRLIHHPWFYRKVHLVHHKSVNPSPWASYSFHLYESFVEAFIAPILLCLVPLHPLSLILFTTISFGFNVYGHLGYEIAPKWFRRSFLFEVMNTSTHHNVHHAKVRGNYGLYFRVWDRLMGTEYPDYVQEYDAIQAKRFGRTI